MAQKLEILVTLRDFVTSPLGKIVSGFRGMGGLATGAVRGITSEVFSLRGALLGLGGTISAGAALKSVIGEASEIENMGVQMRAFTDSAEQSAALLQRVRDLSSGSPQREATQQYVDALQRIDTVGAPAIERTVKLLDGISVIYNRDLTGAAKAFASTSAKALRDFGVEVERANGKAALSSGKFRVVVDDNARAVRAGLIDLWSKRFPDAVGIGTSTATGKLRVLRSELSDLAADVGELILPAYKETLDGLTELVRSNRDRIVAFVATVPEAVAIVLATIRDAGVAVLDFVTGGANAAGQQIVASAGVVLSAVGRVAGDAILIAGKGAVFALGAALRLLPGLLVSAWQLLNSSIPKLLTVFFSALKIGLAPAGFLIAQAFGGGIESAANVIVDGMNAIIRSINAGLAMIGAPFDFPLIEKWEGFTARMAAAADTQRAIVADEVEAIRNSFNTLFDGIDLRENFRAGFADIKFAGKEFIESLAGDLDNLGADLAGVGQALGGLATSTGVTTVLENLEKQIAANAARAGELREKIRAVPLSDLMNSAGAAAEHLEKAANAGKLLKDALEPFKPRMESDEALISLRKEELALVLKNIAATKGLADAHDQALAAGSESARQVVDAQRDQLTNLAAILTQVEQKLVAIKAPEELVRKIRLELETTGVKLQDLANIGDEIGALLGPAFKSFEADQQRMVAAAQRTVDLRRDELDVADRLGASYTEKLRIARAWRDAVRESADQALRFAEINLRDATIVGDPTRIAETTEALAAARAEALSAMADIQAGLDELEPIGADFWAEFIRGAKSAGDSLVVTRKQVRELGQDLARTIGTEHVVDTFVTQLQRARRESLSLGQAFKEASTIILEEIERILLKMIALKILGVITGMFSGGADLGAGQWTSQPTGFATGGVARGRQLAVVGDNASGSEAIVPLPDGRSIPVELRGVRGVAQQRESVVHTAGAIAGTLGPVLKELVTEQERIFVLMSAAAKATPAGIATSTTTRDQLRVVTRETAREVAQQITQVMKVVLPTAAGSSRAPQSVATVGMLGDRRRSSSNPAAAQTVVRLLDGRQLIVDLPERPRSAHSQEVRAFAEGGVVRGPQIAVVGDNASRAEAIVPLPNGRNIPVELRSLPRERGGGDVLHVHHHHEWNVQALDASTFEDLLANRGGKIVKAFTLDTIEHSPAFRNRVRG